MWPLFPGNSNYVVGFNLPHWDVRGTVWEVGCRVGETISTVLQSGYDSCKLQDHNDEFQSVDVDMPIR